MIPCRILRQNRGRLDQFVLDCQYSGTPHVLIPLIGLWLKDLGESHADREIIYVFLLGKQLHVKELYTPKFYRLYMSGI